MGSQVTPPSLENCHCTVGAGVPDAAALKAAVAPVFAAAETGCSVTVGATCATTVSAAPALNSAPAPL